MGVGLATAIELHDQTRVASLSGGRATWRLMGSRACLHGSGGIRGPGIMGFHANADEDGLVTQALCGETSAYCIGTTAD